MKERSCPVTMTGQSAISQFKFVTVGMCAYSKY